MASKTELIVVGYIRENGKQYELIIPEDLFQVFCLFYQCTYKLYGIGEDKSDEMGLKQSDKDETDGWQYLSEMSKLLQHPDYITFGAYNVFIRNFNNEIYGVGANDSGGLGVNKHERKVSDFTSIHIEQAAANLNVDIISKGIFAYHRFIVLQNKETHKQLFYGFGSVGSV